ncbi:ferredoxin--NADP reductase (plasmid) [Pseudoalteromonas sp. T1lg65]|uniref:ferredoxin--NADP reductase n=1 Tax=Pseudoalteromonas sp. T1lg65 TaxID=2077101 RepID=UPI003F79E1FF
MAAWTKGTVSEVIDWNDTLFTVKIKADIAPFVAGQFTKLALDNGDKRIARAYSFVNAPSQSHLEFLLVEVPGGNLSPPLHRLCVGDTVDVATQANGFFVLDELPDCRVLWMMSTGTAIGPFISMLRAGELWQRFEQINLIHGVRKNSDLCYQDELTEIQNTQQTFNYLPLVTRELPELGLRGRITELIRDNQLLQHFGYQSFPEQSHFMLCGNPDMVKETSGLLNKLGFERHRRAKPGHITVEQYW